MLPIRRGFPLAAALLVLALGCSTRRPGQPIRPGFNVYSPQQDIEFGKQAAAEVRKQVDVVDYPELQNYVSRIGERLASQPEAGQYPYSFTLVNDESVNAFALPGGPVFIFTGLLKAADNEAQLAGVLAHEISHVALRHATSEASKASLVQIPAVLGGALLGQGSLLAQLGQFGLGFGLNSLILKYSRDAESEADAMGTKIMAKAGYNPVEMARFFETLKQKGGPGVPQFLSDHPDPGNRIQAVEEEIKTFPRQEYSANTGQFPKMKQLVAQLPPPKKRAEESAAAAAPSPASGQFQQLNTDAVSLGYPAEWRAFEDRNSVTLAPREGLVRTASGGIALGYRAVIGYYHPENQQGLAQASGELIAQLQSANPNLQRSGRERQMSVGGSAGRAVELTGPSPYGGGETDVVVTAARPEGLFYMIFVEPQTHFDQLEGTFDQMPRSIRFRG